MAPVDVAQFSFEEYQAGSVGLGGTLGYETVEEITINHTRDTSSRQ